MVNRTTKIGNLKLKNPIFLAPMHQVNDIAFRLLCKKAGASLNYTGLINPQTREPLFLEDKPILQFACNSPKGIKEFIKKYDKQVKGYDFNLGCPSPHAKKSKIGYFMINNTKAIEEILKTIRSNTKKPLTIKIRKMPEENTKKIIKIAEKYCDAMGVHPRTQAQGYSGGPDLNFARQVKTLTKLPIIYSGNINNKPQAQEMLKEFNFIMIGRSSIGNPNIFSEITNKKIKKFDFKDYLNLAKKYKLYFSQIKFQAINFTRDFEGSSKIRHKLSLAKNEQELLTIMNLKN
ncbi:tRNA-dihydrouridine synthase family protein [Candidatus Pacearchaeota archaeon]|nr:tRNA-dihydrouridine synthase family protein [Candidatus Pacearchaeota archaeon]